MVIVHAASLSDTDGAVDVGAQVRGRFPCLQLVYADQRYRHTMIDWFRRVLQCAVEIVARRQAPGFHVLPQRWKVERTVGWFNWSRLLRKEYDVYVECSAYWVYLASIHGMMRRVARTKSMASAPSP